MNCPICGSSGAYVGFTSIECQNANCKHYKATVTEAFKDGGFLDGPVLAPNSRLLRHAELRCAEMNQVEINQVTLKGVWTDNDAENYTKYIQRFGCTEDAVWAASQIWPDVHQLYSFDKDR